MTEQPKAGEDREAVIARVQPSCRAMYRDLAARSPGKYALPADDADLDEMLRPTLADMYDALAPRGGDGSHG